MKKSAQKKGDDVDDHPIELIYVPLYCQFTTVQRDLKTISQNQRKLYDKMDEIVQILLHNS